MGIRDAGHAEYDRDASHPIISLASCPVPDRPEGAPRLSGKLRVRLDPEAMAFRIYRKAEVEEEFFCNYELDPAFRGRLEGGRLRVAPHPLIVAYLEAVLSLREALEAG
jgi:CTP synthase (UTP-ammonia lyase)